MLKIRNLALAFLAAMSVFMACSWSLNNLPDTNDRELLLTNAIYQVLNRYHYNPAEVDDSFSENLYKMYLERLDPGRRIFVKTDIEQFEGYKNQLDEALKDQDFAFFNATLQSYEKRLKEVEGYYEKWLEQPFDFTKEEQFQTDGSKMEYAANPVELEERWRKYLKWQVLTRVHNKQEAQQKRKEKSDTVTLQSFEELEKEARERVAKNYREWSKRQSLEDREDRLAIFLNSVTNIYGPHTNYFPPIDKENFDIQMSGKLEGIGAQLTQEDGFTKVVRIVPGSASDRQGDLEVNDKIIKVAQGEEEPVDVVDMKLDDVLPLIRGKKDTEVRLTVRKKSGAIKEIPIVRDVVVMEESYAKSAIVTHEETKQKVGVIDLRSFYVDFDDAKGRRAFTDVKEEIRKLKAESIDGLIIDLRFNGGGSLQDVIDMTGLFIEKGPVVQVKERELKPKQLGDRDSEVFYDGPLVILVNSFSASASEIMAAALQDYQRAIIIGEGPSTFGKGTVQRFLNLDIFVPDQYKEEVGELGQIKLTIQKFYRINGGTTQLRGVLPDIVLPSTYSYLETGEKEEKYPLPWDEVSKANYDITGHVDNLRDIQRSSRRRTRNHKAFEMIDENARWIKKQQENTGITLNYDGYVQYSTKIDKQAEKYENMLQPIEALSIDNLRADQPAIQEDDSKAKRLKDWHKNLQKDPYLEEALFVISELN